MLPMSTSLESACAKFRGKLFEIYWVNPLMTHAKRARYLNNRLGPAVLSRSLPADRETVLSAWEPSEEEKIQAMLHYE
jgi:hypothetical protein